MRTRQHADTKDERGSLTLETVIITPVLLLVLMLTVQLALVMHSQSGAQAAAEEGAARARALDGTTGDAQRQAQRFMSELAGGTVTNTSVTANRTAEQATVTVNATVKRIAPFIPLDISRSSTGPVERFVEEPQ